MGLVNMKVIVFVLVILAALLVFAGCLTISETNCRATIVKTYESLNPDKMCLQTETGKQFCTYKDQPAFKTLSGIKFGDGYILNIQHKKGLPDEEVVANIYTLQTAQVTYELQNITNNCG